MPKYKHPLIYILTFRHKSKGVENMLLYHGTPSQLVGAPQPVSPTVQNRTKPRPTDFGTGMYLTEDRDFASLKSCTTAQHSAFLYKFNVDENKLKKLKVYKFEKADLRWLMFLTYNRHIWGVGHAPKFFLSLYKKFKSVDVIIGPTADDKCFSVMKRYITKGISSTYYERKLGHNLLLSYMRATNFYNQFTFATKRACSLLDIVDIKELSLDEKIKNIELNNERAKAMIKTIDKIDEQVPIGEEGYNFDDLLNWINKNEYEWDTIPVDDYDLKYDVANISEYGWGDYNVR